MSYLLEFLSLLLGGTWGVLFRWPVIALVLVVVLALMPWVIHGERVR